ncbi:MAG: gramicidin synthase [Verrucomicrobiales bacterium]|nr:gramicidin synthase [Verrucomicrobiales bacterium]
MSKAFTRDEDAGMSPVLQRPMSPLPPGVKNYITAAGAKRIEDELKNLREIERPRAVTSNDPGKAELLQKIEMRIAYLDQSLLAAEVVQPPAQSDDKVRFGATVTVRDKHGVETKYRIVGVDETDIDRDWVSWRSPVAKALLNATVGQRVKFQIPAGTQEWEIVSINYDEPA